MGNQTSRWNNLVFKYCTCRHLQPACLLDSRNPTSASVQIPSNIDLDKYFQDHQTVQNTDEDCK